MKNFLLSFLLISITPLAYCQVKYNKTKVPQLPLEGRNIVYTAAVTLDSSYTKEQLFDNAQQWYKRNYQSSDNRLTINDLDAGRLSGTGIIHSKGKKKDILPQDIFFTINMTIAKGTYTYLVDSIYGFENRVKFYYSDMYSEELYTQNTPKWTKPYRQAMLTGLNKNMIEMTGKLRSSMAKK